jgi:hypothetical protein
MLVVDREHNWKKAALRRQSDRLSHEATSTMGNVRGMREGRVGKLVIKRNEQVLSNTVTSLQQHYKFQDYKNSHA